MASSINFMNLVIILLGYVALIPNTHLQRGLWNGYAM